ncbi:MAG: hypothetical protein KGK08_11485 [Acidobacteriota bacterium]|nr:hypothetical protein [Acidobacteriota bacterium]
MLSTGMQILFAISIVCFFAIVWAALAFARHIKASTLRSQARAAQDAHHAPAEDSFRAQMTAAMHFAQDAPPSYGSSIAPTQVERPRPAELHQNVRDITAAKGWNLPVKSATAGRRVAIPVPRVDADHPHPGLRKPPQPARHGAMAFLDPAYFNKDAGDLSDPYQPPRIPQQGR